MLVAAFKGSVVETLRENSLLLMLLMSIVYKSQHHDQGRDLRPWMPFVFCFLCVWWCVFCV